MSYRLLKRMSKVELHAYLALLPSVRPCALYAHYGVDAAYFLPLKTATGLPVITQFYGHDCSSFPRRLFGLGRLYLRGLFGLGDVFLAMSEDMKRDLVALGCPRNGS